MRVVILGCGGFVGSHLLDNLLDDPRYQIEGWDPEDRKIRRHLVNPRFTLHRTVAHAPEALVEVERAIVHCDVVINLAAICNPADYNTQPLAVIRANLFDVYPIVELCAKHRRWLVSFSTSETYGRTISSYLPASSDADPDLYELREDETPLIMGPIRNQRWTYACAKQMTERLIYAHHTEEGLPFTIIRPLNFFGPRMDYIPTRDGDGVPRVLACFMAALLSGEPMQLVDGGHARRTIVSIYEAVDAIRRVLEKPEASQNQIFNIGNRQNEVTMAELADLMRRTYATITGDPRYNDHPIVTTSAEQFYGKGYEDCDRRMPDIGKAERLLGWVPTMRLPEILLGTMRSYHDEYAVPKAA
ncbi:MAG TPA: NAD-dependent epimerase/dehydratase family protein [Geminicoccus sp.]|uniref:NAD-dependent epimerase/dehydratase family protein n=1 Tax=Geminicoccus sp. TaxID=2024832 RepID=UPI002E303FDC|nr:NAD-dependent epimerase/dehydratase family protein [Geminicoccus sp.]HEX2525997.1 NAD-dependent epimerase/dehydratase family protein [Geminicoccus sp.]